MSEIARITRSTAKQNPGQAFTSPAEIVGEIMLTRGEKLGALERWRLDVLQQLNAADEGMRSDDASGHLARLLHEIEAATRDLSERQAEAAD